MTIATGQTIDHRFRIDRTIASGGMGTVYQAHDLKLQRPVALKVMRPDLAADPDYQRRFEIEAQAAAGLASCPHIVAVIDFSRAGGYLVMEYVTGGSLLDHLARHRAQPLAFVLEIGRQTALGLAAAHAASLVHRDIKPANLLLAPNNTPAGGPSFTIKIADFGIVRVRQAAVGAAPTGAGWLTPGYAAPEQLQGQSGDARADLYALGVVLYELMVGALPPLGDLAAAKAALRAYRTDVGPVVESIVLSCLEPNPSRRIQDAAALARALYHVAQPLPPPALPAGAGHLTRVSPQPAQGPLTGLATYQPTQTPSPWPRLRVKLGQAPAQAYDLTPAGLTLGRDPGNSIPLADPDVSRQHLALSWDGAQVRVTDLGSSNGTLLGGQRLPPRVATPWPYGTPVQLGACLLQLSPPSLAAAGPPAAGAQAATRRMSRRLQQAQTRGQRLALDVGPGEDTLQLTPGQPAQIALLLFNLDRQIDHVTLGVSGAPAAWLSLPAQPQALAPEGDPGCDLVLPLTISLPRRPEAAAGERTVTLRATSGVDPSFVATVELTWQVQAFAAGELTLSPKRSRASAGGAHTLSLRNGGNAPVSYALSGEDDELALEYHFRPARVSLKPGEEQQVSLDLTAKRAAPAERTHQLTVLARPEGGGPTLTAQGEFVQEVAALAPVPVPASAIVQAPRNELIHAGDQVYITSSSAMLGGETILMTQIISATGKQSISRSTYNAIAIFIVMFQIVGVVLTVALTLIPLIISIFMWVAWNASWQDRYIITLTVSDGKRTRKRRFVLPGDGVALAQTLQAFQRGLDRRP